MKTLALAFCAALVLFARAADADGISGYVRDEHGNAVPHIKVVINSYDGSTSAETLVTDDRGFFSDITIRPGRYAVIADGGYGAFGCTTRNVYDDELTFVNERLGRGDIHCRFGSPSLVDPNATADVYRI